MMRSMYSGVSGLRAHQLKMDVIGNNIANVNTVGFKSSQASFQQVFSQTSSGASAPQGGRGGTNPQQVGLGVSMGSIRVNHTPGSAQRTDNPLDFFIGGDGYFVVSGDSNFGNKSYTRAGNFDLDRDGTLVTGEGLKVLGYVVDEKGNVSDELSDIKIDKSNTVGATTTENMKLKGNLDSRVKADKDGNLPKVTTDTVIYDSLGNPYNVKYELTKPDDDKSEWEARIVSMKNSDGKQLLPNTGTDTNPKYTAMELGKISFDDKGQIEPLDSANIGSGDGINGTINTDNKFAVNINIGWSTNDEINPSIDPDAKSSFGKGGEIIIDFSSLTQYGNDSTVKASSPDGNTSGNIESFSVSKSGEVVAVYTNGESKVLAQVALAKFDNPGGLSSEGSNLFKDTRNSGEAQFGKAGSSGYGQILGGAVEMSNVDLSNEFTEMITTQRGFQANSRIITTSDEMLQELMSLKR